MKFRKDGKVFNNIELARLEYCAERNCYYCKLKSIWDCYKFCENKPVESAELMGFEVIEDNAESTFDISDIANMTLTQVKEYCRKHNETCSKCALNVNGNGFRMCGYFVREWKLEPKPKLTQQELEICKALGAKYVTRDCLGSTKPHLWAFKPVKVAGCYSCVDTHSLAIVSAKLFPSVKPGDCICVEDLLNDSQS